VTAADDSRTAALVVTDSAGQGLPVRWNFAGAEALTWERDLEHWALGLTPIELWFYGNARAGERRAWAEVGLPVPRSFDGWQMAGPFVYYCASPEDEGFDGRLTAASARLRRRFGGNAEFWGRHCRPKMEAAVGWIHALDHTAAAAAVAETWGYAWHQTFTPLALLDTQRDRVGALLEPSLGPEEAALLALEVCQAGANASQAVDAEVRALARLATAGDVAALVTAGSAVEALQRLRVEPAAAPFLVDFDSLVARHALRSEGWDFERPTWGERPDLVLRLVRASLAAGDVDLEAHAAGSLSRRDAAIERALSLVAAGAKAELRELARDLAGYVEVRESRAYWQMVLTGAVRLWLLRAGHRLAADEVIERPGDVLYLLGDELDAARGSGPGYELRDAVGRRREALERWRAATPPAAIGAASPAPVPAGAGDGVEHARLPASRSDGAPPGASALVLSGVAVSRGVAIGRVRVLTGPGDWDTFEAGEVLVCTLTTPAWTPLFGLAAAVVTESGNAVSHPAITAREYGIPAVLAVAGACRALRSGDLVRVDGAAGEVTRLPE
jgi:phosphohistidine swiveling domain-containing protein